MSYLWISVCFVSLSFTVSLRIPQNVPLSPGGEGENKACNSDPDNVHERLFFRNCNPADPITVNNVQLNDASGNAVYPVDLTKPLVLSASSTNNGKVYNKILVDVSLSYWGGWLGCSWHTVPTFGLLNNIDQCPNCPLQTGAITMNVPIDISKYSAILTHLTSGTPYQLTVTVRDGDSPNDQIACITVELIMKK